MNENENCIYLNTFKYIFSFQYYIVIRIYKSFPYIRFNTIRKYETIPEPIDGTDYETSTEIEFETVYIKYEIIQFLKRIFKI